MAQSSLKKTLNTLDPYPRSCQKVSSNNIWNPNTKKKNPLSSVSRDLQKNCISNPLIRKRWQTNLLNEEIKKLLHEKLVRRVVQGRPFETLQFHKKQLIKELGEWIGISSENGNDYYRNKLLSLLVTSSKQNFKDVPSDNSEWIKLLNKWLKANTSGAVLSNREIYKILSVDGFRGFKPKYLKYYLPEILLPLRKEYESHANGVRCMYDFFTAKDCVSSLTGTDSACVIFLALLEWFSLRLKNDLMLDDQIMFQVQQTKLWAEGYLQQNVEYYPDIKNVNGELLKMFGKVYEDQYNDDSWKIVGRELLMCLNKQD